MFSIQLSKINLAHSSATFQVRKHTFKASVACNGREVLRGTPGRRHGISAIEAADCLGNREPTIHWKVSRTSAARREGSRKHLSPSAMRSEPVGRIGGSAVLSRCRQSHAPSSLKGRFLGRCQPCVSATSPKKCISPLFYGAKKISTFFSLFQNACREIPISRQSLPSRTACAKVRSLAGSWLRATEISSALSLARMLLLPLPQSEKICILLGFSKDSTS